MNKNQRSSVTLYNVLFPIWLLIIFPPIWLAVLPANFIIDSLVVVITLKCLHIKSIRNHYKSSILKVWLLGFTADIIGAVLLLMTQIMDGDWMYEYIIGPVSYNPWDNIYSLSYVGAVVIITGVFIYFFNTKISLKKTTLSVKEKRTVALALAIFTAPYVFLVPSQLTFSHSREVHCFTSHLLSPGYDLYSVVSSRNEYSRYPLVGYEQVESFQDALETADRIRKVDENIVSSEPDYIIELNMSYRTEDWQKFLVWNKDDEVLIQAENKWYRVEKKRTLEFIHILEETSLKDRPPVILFKDTFDRGENKVFIFEDDDYKYFLMSQDNEVYAEFDNNYLEVQEALRLNITTQEDLLQLPVEWIKEAK